MPDSIQKDYKNKGGIQDMEITDFLKALVEHNKTKNGYQVYLNSDSLDEKSARSSPIWELQ